MIDLAVSDSPDAMMKKLGVSWLERKLAESAKINAVYTQSDGYLKIESRATAFFRIEDYRLDGQIQSKVEGRTGPYTICSRWEGNKLVQTSEFKTRDGRKANLTLIRALADGGKTLELIQSLQIEGETQPIVVRRVWRRHES
jgi:hypothetical protein